MKSYPLNRRPIRETMPPWGVAIFETHHAPDFEMEWRRHSFFKIIYVLTGEGSLLIENEEFKFVPRDILFVPSGANNRIIDSPEHPVSLYLLCISRERLAFCPTIDQLMKAGRRARNYHIANRAESLLRRLLFQHKHNDQDASLGMVADALSFLQLVLPSNAINKENDSSDDEMENYLNYLDSHFYEASSLTAAAERLGVSRRTFTKWFRDATGSTWNDYVREKAIKHSKILLADTDAPIAAIAFECGFSDLSTFYRQFKSRTGTSPAAWRSSLQSS